MNHYLNLLNLLVICLLLAACAAPREFSTQRGEASWYGPNFHGQATANGETYDQNALTAAHRTLPFDTVVRVINLDNGQSVVVRINDRGPYAKGRIIDLSRKAAEEIDMVESGVAPVRLQILDSPEPIDRQRVEREIFTIQLASFPNHRNAESFADRISGARVERALRDGETLFRVYYGSYNSAERAKHTLDEIHSRGFEEAFVKQVQN